MVIQIDHRSDILGYVQPCGTLKSEAKALTQTRLQGPISQSISYQLRISAGWLTDRRRGMALSG